MPQRKLLAASKGFRENYLSHDQITAQLQAWAEAFPEIVCLESIGKTPEGRDLWVLTIGGDRSRVRPAVWVDGNMHATELCGSSVALAIAEDAISFHAGLVPASAAEIPAAVADRLREIVFHVMPRMSPDGAEAVLRTGQYVRSVPRDARAAQRHPRWINEDVDGDGTAALMRLRDPSGEFVESKDAPGWMVPRQLGDDGPFYRVYPEGRIEHFDGKSIPAAEYLADHEPDLNRNFPAAWMPEHEQVGAGRYATSEPESRAVVEFATARPNIFAWLNLHTYGGCFIRPAGDKPDTKMNQDDLAIYREIGETCEALTTYPMVSGFEEFTYEHDKSLKGDISDWAYLQRGCIAYVCELWDFFKRLGMPRPKRFVDYYGVLGRADVVKLAELDKTLNKGRMLLPWRKFTHPQLGEVEIGGLDSRVGISNPPNELLADICRTQSAAWMYTAALLPRVRITKSEVVALGGGLSRVDVVVENDGYLGTVGIPSAAALAWNEPLWAEAKGRDGLSLVTDSESRQELGHLEGWGRGKGTGSAAVWFQRSRGSRSRRTTHFVVRGSGTLDVRVGSCRIGELTARIEVEAR